MLPLLQPALTDTKIANKLNPMGIGDCKRLRGAGLSFWL
jgi:hypothetical protein